MQKVLGPYRCLAWLMRQHDTHGHDFNYNELRRYFKIAPARDQATINEGLDWIVRVINDRERFRDRDSSGEK